MWDKSLARSEKKLKKLKDGQTYTKADHHADCDEWNNGITHFGIHTEYLNRENIRFDVFHLRCAVTRRLMSRLREYLMRTTPDLINDFSMLLGSFFSEYNVLLWNLNKPFTILKGPELLEFIKKYR